VHQDFDTLVAQTEEATWKETLAVLITYTQGPQYRALCTALGDRLVALLRRTGAVSTSSPPSLAWAQHPLSVAATTCYVCAANVDKAVWIWGLGADAYHAQFQAQEGAGDDEAIEAEHGNVARLQSMVEKIYGFSNAIKPQQLPPAPVLGTKFSYEHLGGTLRCCGVLQNAH
jgi:hypothetical protein